MADGPRRRRRALVLPLLGLGVAAWVVRRKLGERHGIDGGWQPLPPAPVAATAPVGETSPTDAQAASVAATAPVAETSPAKPATESPEATASADTAEARARAVPAATAVASVTAPALPDAPFGPGSLSALADGSSPDPDYVVKGKTATKVFHAPGGAYYTRTRADVWFRSARDARAAGFTERTRRQS
jgi:hypothetical protein